MAFYHAIILWAVSVFASQLVLNKADPETCDTIQQGYVCRPAISHYWGEYSPYFSVPSDISADLPDGCQYTFASILSRHGARDPTARKSHDYKDLINQIKSHARSSFTGKYAFLSDYEYTLGADNLTDFGRQELVNSGIKFFERYSSLTSDHGPFVRASGQRRVVDSAENFVLGYKSAMGDTPADHSATSTLGKSCNPGILVIPENIKSNNTLSHGVCKAFISPTYDKIAEEAQAQFIETFINPIINRLNHDLRGVKFHANTTINLMDLCPFETVADPIGSISPFCDLFTETEWHAYNYYESLNKFYGYGPANPLGPTQGVGYAAELLARLTNDSSYVQNKNSYTSINHSLDSDPCTFPLGKKLYADFSHDNDVTSAMSAIGLFDFLHPKLLRTDHLVEPEVNGYAAAWTVPFSGRVYFEKMICENVDGELVRVVANDRVMPLTGCDADKLGRCKLDAFVNSRTFAKEGGRWNKLC